MLVWLFSAWKHNNSLHSTVSHERHLKGLRTESSDTGFTLLSRQITAQTAPTFDSLISAIHSLTKLFSFPRTASLKGQTSFSWCFIYNPLPSTSRTASESEKINQKKMYWSLAGKWISCSNSQETNLNYKKKRNKR